MSDESVAGRARSIRQSGMEHGWSATQIAQAIHEQCGVTLLKAHRLARGWTLVELAERIRKQQDSAGTDLSRIAHQRISRWEAGAEFPSPRYLDSLCRVYETRPDLLGLGRDYAVAEPEEGATQPAEPHPFQPVGLIVGRKEFLLAVLTGTGTAIAAPVLEVLGGVRRDLEKTLAGATTSASMLDSWEERVNEYGFAFRYVSPGRLLREVAADLAEVRQLAEHRQPLESQRRIYHIATQLTAIGALALSDLSLIHESNAWFRTARAIADETNDRRLRAWVLAKEATELLFQGQSPELAIDRARRAQAIGGRTPSAGLAIACSAESRAQATLRRGPETATAMARAKEVFGRLPPHATSSSVAAYSERQLLYHEGDALTVLGASQQALRVHRAAAAHYPSTEPLEPALIRINEAKCLAQLGDVGGACRHATDTLNALPGEYRDTVIAVRGREVLDLVPARLRGKPECRELDELLRGYAPRTA